MTPDNPAHPMQDVIAALRELLLGVDPSISEEVKWNSPSFRTTEHFATMHLRNPKAVQLILHLGAKTKTAIPKGALADPDGLLKWLGDNRASVSITGAGDLERKHDALSAIVRQWIRFVP